MSDDKRYGLELLPDYVQVGWTGQQWEAQAWGSDGTHYAVVGDDRDAVVALLRAKATGRVRPAWWSHVEGAP